MINHSIKDCHLASNKSPMLSQRPHRIKPLSFNTVADFAFCMNSWIWTNRHLLSTQIETPSFNIRKPTWRAATVAQYPFEVPNTTRQLFFVLRTTKPNSWILSSLIITLSIILHSGDRIWLQVSCSVHPYPFLIHNKSVWTSGVLSGLGSTVLPSNLSFDLT